MKSVKILSILYLLFSFCTEYVNAQTSQKKSDNLLNGSATISYGDWNNTYGQRNSLGLYGLASLIQPGTNITENINPVFISINRSYNYLIIKPILYNSTDYKFTGKSTSMAGYGNYGSFSGKWASLTGKPIIETSGIYNSPLKRTNHPAYSNNHFYHATANIFNFVMNAKYPSLNAPK
jgi:hypothetical protein